ncbi:MAG: hypothetical protein AAB250_11165, partial [Bdellovibrionota bacterium]
GQERLTVTSTGNIGIGSSSPTVALDVNGEMKAKSISGSFNDAAAGSSLDFTTGNTQTTTYDCGSAIALSNMRDGGSYTIIVTGTGTNTCTFTHTDVTGWRFLPANGARTASTHSIYTILKAGTLTYVNWQSGF